MKLDESQSFFLEKFKDHTKNFDVDFMILTGSAGTGKTELIKKCVEYLKINNFGHQCLAFTGRAASVLRSRGLENAKTIDSWLYRLNNKYTHEKELNPYDNFIFFIDESSMISNSAIIFDEKEPELDFKLDEIMWSTFRHIKCKNILFVFVGDKNQLPPLKHDYCPALNEDYLSNRYGLLGKSYSLKTMHRQTSESNIPKLAENFLSFDNEISKAIPSIEKIEKDVQIIENSEVVDIFFDLYFENKHDVKIITATNKKADYYNFLIKEKLSTGKSKFFTPYQIPKDNLEPQKGDILQIFANSSGIFDFPMFNGQFLEVLELGRVSETILKKGNRIFDNIPFITQQLTVDTISDSGERASKPQTIEISIDHLINSYSLTKQEYEYFDKKDTGMLNKIKDYISKIDSKRVYFNKLYNPVLTRYGYAITGHKAQGGGWKNIIIDFSGFNDDKGHLPPSWIYTAITRAKSNLFVANYPTEENNE